MHKYYRVRFADTRPYFVRVGSECDRWLRGIEVNRFGDEVTAKGVDEKLHIIEKPAVALEEYRMNNTYAELERVG